MATVMTNMTEVTNHLTRAFEDEFKEQLGKEFERAIEDFKQNKLPGMIARASSCVSIQLNQRSDSYGLELSFRIIDMESIKKTLKE